MEAATAPQPRREGLGTRRRGALRGFAQILGPHDHTLAIHRQYQNRCRVRIGASACLLAIRVKRLEILRRPDHQFLELTLRHVRACISLQLHPLVKRALGRFGRHSPPHFQRVLLRRQIERVWLSSWTNRRESDRTSCRRLAKHNAQDGD
jgi:hypothetical protein